MKIATHQIEKSDLEMAMFKNSIATMRAKRQAWKDPSPRSYEKHAAIARAAERARKARQSEGGEF